MFMVATFYVANIYDHVLAERLFYAKWLAVLPVIVLSVRLMVRGKVSSAVPPLLPLLSVAFVASLSVLNAENIGNSLVILASLLLAFISAYTLASAIMKNGGERQFFDAIARVGRAVIVSAAVMWPLGLSLGRGEATASRHGPTTPTPWHCCSPPRSSF